MTRSEWLPHKHVPAATEIHAPSQISSFIPTVLARDGFGFGSHFSNPASSRYLRKLETNERQFIKYINIHI